MMLLWFGVWAFCGAPPIAQGQWWLVFLIGAAAWDLQGERRPKC